MSIGLSVLSWRGAESLRPSLESYAKVGLFDLFDETQLFLPDPDDDVLHVSKQFNLTTKTLPQNLGIMENMVVAASKLSTDYILMLENDCPLIEPISEVRRQISKSLDLLSRDDVIMARFRSVRAPGQAFGGLDKYRRLNDGTLRAKLTGLFRPKKSHRLSGYALYDGPNSIAKHPNNFEYVDGGFYLIDASVMPWTNQSILIDRTFFLDKIVPLARSIETRRHANNLPNLEIELNKSQQWQNSKWKIACGPGLFTHERIGDRGYT